MAMLVASGVKRTADEDGDAESKRPRVAEHCALSTEEILSKVEERENARKCKDFATSDQLRDALRDMGVDLIDKSRIWKSSDGRCGLLSRDRMGQDQLQALVGLREQERTAKNWEMADKLREVLKEAGVTLHDKTNSWTTDDNRGGSCGRPGMPPGGSAASAAQYAAHPGAAYSPYAQSPYAPPPVVVSELEVLMIVEQQEAARLRSDVAVQYALRTLLHTKGVHCDDARWEWRMHDGRTGPMSYADPRQYHAALTAAAMAPPAPPPGYPPPVAHHPAAAPPQWGPPPPTGPPPPPGPPPALPTDTEALILRREQERARRNWAMSDSIRDMLRARGINLNDKAGLYDLNDGAGARPYPPGK